MKSNNEKYMAMALAEARKAAKRGEVPVGAVLISGGRVIAKAHNLTRTLKDPTAHAEMVVMRLASQVIGNERFTDATLFVTLEPCPMCAGGIIQARIPDVVYAADDPKAGACGSVINVIPNANFNHRPNVVRGVLAKDSAGLLKKFFKMRRK